MSTYAGFVWARATSDDACTATATPTRLESRTANNPFIVMTSGGVIVELLNEPVRPQYQRLRHRQTEDLRGLEVDHQLQLRRLLDGKISRLGALENSVHEVGGLAEIGRPVRPV